jgi:signal peptide peptidase SppA
MREKQGLWAVHESVPGMVAAVMQRAQDGWVDAQSRALAAGLDGDALLAAQGLATTREGGAGGVAVVPMKGVFYKDCGPVAEAFFGLLDTARLTREILALAKDDDVNGVIIPMDSPGGLADGVAELGEAVAFLAKRKPTHVQVMGICASAAYWVGSQARKIYAGRMGEVGSIGVRMLMYDYSGLFEEAKIRPVAIDTGEYKSLGAMGLPVTENHEAYLQESADFLFDAFLSEVAKGRGMKKAEVKASADGRTWYAGEAKKRGLIDGIRGMDETVSATMKEATGRRRRVESARRRRAEARVLR